MTVVLCKLCFIFKYEFEWFGFLYGNLNVIFEMYKYRHFPLSDENSGLDSPYAAGVFMASEDFKGHPDMCLGEDVAQCSEELVITKVEDTNEMTLDRNEDYNGMTEVDGSEDSGSLTNVLILIKQCL